MEVTLHDTAYENLLALSISGNHYDDCHLLIALVGGYFWSIWSVWCKEFGEDTYERWHEDCPSNSRIPPVIPENEVRKAQLAVATEKRPSIVENIAATKAVSRESKSLLSPGRPSPVIKHGSSESIHLSSKVHQNSKHDMNHIRVSFWDYVWASFFVAPNAILLWVSGILLLLVRQALHRCGLLSPKSHDPSHVVGKLLLESMEVLQFTCQREEQGEIIATFCWTNFPMLDKNGFYKVADLFSVDVNLNTTTMTKAKLDDNYLTPKEAMILIWFHTISAGHVKLHAYANWGINNSICDRFVRRMSVVTVVYNYYGYTAFKKLTALWKYCGLCRHDFCNITEVFNHGLEAGVGSHHKLRRLMKYSRLVDFLMKARKGFMKAFDRYRESLHGIDGEAMFIGTILHSLDHTLAERNLEDPLWLDTESEEYGVMAELGRFVRVGFVEDLPGLLFHIRYKDSPHPFYQEVYRYAAGIDQDLAGHMDACIVK